MQIVDFRYVRLGTRDVKAAIEFGINIIGLEHVGTENGFAYMRGDDRDHNICYFEGDPADQTIGFQVASMADLEEAIADFKEGGITVERGDENECYHRRVKAFIKFKDPGGNKLEFSVGAYSSGVRYFPGRDAGIKEMHHFGLTSTNPMSDESFWQKYMKMQVTDRIGDDVTLFTYDSAHHRGGLAKGSGVPNRDKVGKVTRAQIEEIVEVKKDDLNASDLDAAVRIIEGTARSMGIEVE